MKVDTEGLRAMCKPHIRLVKYLGGTWSRDEFLRMVLPDDVFDAEERGDLLVAWLHRPTSRILRKQHGE